MYLFFNRLSPSTESGHGLRRLQTCAQSVFSASPKPSILYSWSSWSRIRRCKSSRLVQGISPLRTLFIAGAYPRRQRSVNSVQSTFKPLARPHLVVSAIRELRQSTTVPKVSKTQAFTLANSGCIPGAPPVRGRAKPADRSEIDDEMKLAPAASKNPRRSMLRSICSHPAMKAEKKPCAVTDQSTHGQYGRRLYQLSNRPFVETRP